MRRQEPSPDTPWAAIYADQLGWFGGSMGRQSYGSPISRVWEDRVEEFLASLRTVSSQWREHITFLDPYRGDGTMRTAVVDEKTISSEKPLVQRGRCFYFHQCTVLQNVACCASWELTKFSKQGSSKKENSLKSHQ